jgi:hypothetical protein
MSHHRGHAVGFLVEASGLLKGAQERWADYMRSADVPDTEEFHLHRRWTAYYFSQTGQAIVEALVGLRAQEAARLDDVRRILNQPQPDEPRAATREIVRAVTHMAALLALTSKEPGKMHDERKLGDTQAHASRCWESLDRAIWHVNDAIREELFNDPAAQP